MVIHCAEQLISRPNFHSSTTFTENCVAVQLKPEKVVLDKPIYIVMILHIKYTILVVFVIFISKSDVSSNDTDDESDEDKLKQALILVDILKLAYVKALKENIALRAGTPTPQAEELETCAMSTGLVPDNRLGLRKTHTDDKDTTTTTTTPTRSTRFLETSPLAPLSPYPQEQYPRRYYRRYMPREYFYYDVWRNDLPYSLRSKDSRRNDLPYSFRRKENNLRQFDYNMFEAPANNSNLETSTATTVTTTSTTATTPAALPPAQTTPDQSTTETILQSSDAVKEVTTSVVNGDEANDENKIKINFKKDNPQIQPQIQSETTKDPVHAQVVSELKNELKDKGTKSKPIKGNITIEFTKKPTRKWPWFVQKPTIRVHLAGSSKFPVPLPENNAYCFFNPDSALCRTFIK